MRRVHFGVSLPQLGCTWQQTRAAAVELERLGFNSLWLCDHLFGVPHPRTPVLEAWTTLAAVAAVTSRVELGTLVTPVGFRNPVLLGKMAATVDRISNGRLIPGLGAGWLAREYAGYGFHFPPIRVRLEQLAEAAQVLKLLWGEDTASFSGKYFHLEVACREPRPIRVPPLMIGGSGESLLLRIVAQHAAIWNNPAAKQDRLGENAAMLREHCAAIGRDPATITVSQHCVVAIARDPAGVAPMLSHARDVYGAAMVAAGPFQIAGTPARCIQQIEKLVDRGCSMLVIQFAGPDIRMPAALFAESVVPAFS